TRAAPADQAPAAAAPAPEAAPAAPAPVVPAANAAAPAGQPAAAATADSALTQHELTVVNVVEKVMPAVVGVGVELQRGNQLGQGLGSGFIIDPNGYIVTNAHVVQGASRVAVALGDGRSFAGTVLGSDQQNDLALIKIEATDLPTVGLGDSTTLRPGQTAI